MNNPSDNMNQGKKIAPEENTAPRENGNINRVPDGYGSGMQMPVREAYNSNPQRNNIPPYGARPNQPMNGNVPPYGARPNQPMNGNVPPYGARPNQPMNGNVPPYGARPDQPSPSAVYYRNQQGTAPQYHYGNPTFQGVILNDYYHEQNRITQERSLLSKRLKSIGNILGGAALATYVLGIIFSLIITVVVSFSSPDSFLLEVYNAFVVTVSGGSFFQIIYTLFVVGVGFWFFREKMSTVCSADFKTPLREVKNSPRIPIPFNAPKGGARAPLVILIGFGGCMLANYVCIILSVFFTAFGLPSASYSGPDPTNYWDIIAMFCSTAIIPALIEELALRGFMMTPMRKYGNGFAIFLTAFAFGVFHGNIDQIPFAFISGLFLGYAVVVTDSLWTGVIIHALNNSVSCFQQLILMESGEGAAGSFFGVVSLAGIVIGIIALVVYLKRYKNEDIPALKSKNPIMNTSKMIKTAMASPAMIAMTVIFIISAISDRLSIQ